VPKNNPTQEPSMIRGLRSLIGDSQTVFSEKVGISQSKLSRIEQSKVSLKKGDADKIAKVLGVDASLLGGDDD